MFYSYDEMAYNYMYSQVPVTATLKCIKAISFLKMIDIYYIGIPIASLYICFLLFKYHM